MKVGNGPEKENSEEPQQLSPVLSALFARRYEICREALPGLFFDPWSEWEGSPTAQEQNLVERNIIDIDFGRAAYLLHRQFGPIEDERTVELLLVRLIKCLYLRIADSSSHSRLIVDFCHDVLNRECHLEYLDGILDSRRELGEEYLSLEASQTWILYWIAHSMDILDHCLSDAEALGIINFCESCRSEKGGFGGGPGHRPHAAATFAAVSALCIAANQQPEAYDIIERQKFLHWASHELKTKLPEGSAFRVSRDGEYDVRATYCVLATASLLGVLTRDLTADVASWISSLRSFDGGFGGEPSNEAHGGYTFCAIACLKILHDAGYLCDEEFEKLVSPSRHWLQSRQRLLEGGFQGRTNKLVDSCYAFWLGAACKIAEVPFNAAALERYLLRYCQDTKNGGFRDKPGADPDFYHTCYALSGLCLTAQSQASTEYIKTPLPEINPVYNLTKSTFCAARDFFGS
ncbi:hypothetical protein F1559_001658 [Cyanidiococcus yangmingshanensis]|uniref:Prenyltransferase alpha-alpha toroid domain-containing protein n=1 Tax=Cyanidiococcus yangmingshanensis TaxID=2690220 RepID=A0A7J7IC75_9RHOD|nr:hypothetical protein F1559_001658 [Cyanidiococcus yangmingshanensis]